MARRVYNRFCPLSLALEDVGDRWTLHVVYALLSGPKRYVGRRTGARPGSETTYYLTERGLALAPAVQALAQWGMPSLTLAVRRRTDYRTRT